MGNISFMVKNSAASVLVVDDEALIRWSLSEALGDRGYAVVEAGSAKDALASIAKAETPFDIVILDFRLPDSADLRLLARIKELMPVAEVIMVTAHNSPELSQGAAALGAFRVISKPFDMENLAELVKQAHGTRH